MNPTYDFRGQVALVTGAGSGMGLATARAFADAGAAVALADINEAAVARASETLNATDHRTIAMNCDVADESQAAAMVERTVATFGRLEWCTTMPASSGPMGDVTDETGKAFDDVHAVNLRGIWTCTKHELLQMRKQGSGAIVNCSSLGGLVGLPGRAAYHASKHGASFVPGVALPVDGGFTAH